MKTLQQLSFAVLCIALIITGCGKNNNASTSTANLLVSGTWNLQLPQYQKADGTWINEPDWQVTLTSMTLAFTASNTFSQLANGSLSHSGTYSLSSDNSQITIVGGALIAATYSIDQLTQSSLVITDHSQYYFAGTTYNARRLTFTQ